MHYYEPPAAPQPAQTSRRPSPSGEIPPQHHIGGGPVHYYPQFQPNEFAELSAPSIHNPSRQTSPFVAQGGLQVPITKVIPPTPQNAQKLPDSRTEPTTDSLVVPTFARGDECSILGPMDSLTDPLAPPTFTSGDRERSMEHPGQAGSSAEALGPMEGLSSHRGVLETTRAEPSEDAGVGRISDENWKHLQSGFQKLDQIIVDISAQTGLSDKQILAQWERRTRFTSQEFHSWNVYANYFKLNQTEEIQRTYGRAAAMNSEQHIKLIPDNLTCSSRR
jgi:hypothetical protein